MNALELYLRVPEFWRNIMKWLPASIFWADCQASLPRPKGPLDALVKVGCTLGRQIVRCDGRWQSPRSASCSGRARHFRPSPRPRPLFRCLSPTHPGWLAAGRRPRRLSPSPKCSAWRFDFVYSVPVARFLKSLLHIQRVGGLGGIAYPAAGLVIRPSYHSSELTRRASAIADSGACRV